MRSHGLARREMTGFEWGGDWLGTGVAKVRSLGFVVVPVEGGLSEGLFES